MDTALFVNALKYLHEKGIIHRDLNVCFENLLSAHIIQPDNVLINKDGVLIDFETAIELVSGKPPFDNLNDIGKPFSMHQSL